MSSNLPTDAPDSAVRGGHVAFLDVLRAIAISVVVLHHYRHLPGCPELLKWLAMRGYLGVDIFFVLSGWLIAGQLFRELRAAGKVELGRFWLRRWLRTLPAYYVMWAIRLQLDPQRMRFRWPMLVFAQNYLAPHAWLVTWSLCVEEHFYLALPLVVALVRLAGRWAAAIGAGLVVLTVVASPLWRLHSYDPSMNFEAYLADLYFLTHLRLDGLAIGVGIAALDVYGQRWWRALQRGGRWTALAGGALMLSAAFNPWWVGFTAAASERLRPFALGPQFTLVALGTALAICGGVAAHRAGRTWRVPGARWVSEHAYALYLCHGLVNHLWPKDQPFWMALPLSLAAAAVVAALLRRLVELPVLGLRDRWRAAAFLPRPAAAPPVAAVPP